MATSSEKNGVNTLLLIKMLETPFGIVPGESLYNAGLVHRIWSGNLLI
jgi:hypothetical protein